MFYNMSDGGDSDGAFDGFHANAAYEFDLFGDDYESSLDPVDQRFDDRSPPDVGQTDSRSRVNTCWRCYRCNADNYTWSTSRSKWTCMACGSDEFYDVTQPRRHETQEGCWLYLPKTNSDDKQSTVSEHGPPDDPWNGDGERNDSEGHTTDPIVDPDTLSVQGRRRRRRARRTNQTPETDVQQSNNNATAGNDQIVDLLTQLVANQNKKSDSSNASWTSRQGPFKGVRWRGGTPPSPPAWKNSNDLRAFARWERKIDVWTMQIKPFMPMPDAALMLFTSLTGEAELETEHLDLNKINSPDGIKYLMDSLREPLQQKLLFQKRKLLADYEQIARYPNESVRQFSNRYVRVEKDLAAIGVSTSGMYDSESRGNRLLERTRSHRICRGLF